MWTVKATQSSKEFQQLKAGIYHAVIIEIVSKTSRNNNEMLEIHLQLDDMGETILKEYLFEPDGAEWKVNKIQRFMRAIGKDFEKGEEIALDEKELIGATLAVVTYLKKEAGFKDPSKTYTNPKIKALRPIANVKNFGAMDEKELAYWGLNSQGFDLNDIEEEKAANEENKGAAFDDDDDVPF